MAVDFLQKAAKILENIEVLEVVPKSPPRKTPRLITSRLQSKELLELARAGGDALKRRVAPVRGSGQRGGSQCA